METLSSDALLRCKNETIDINPTTIQRFALVRRSSLFDGLSDSECFQIAQDSRQKTFSRNEVVFRQDEQFQKLILIESGFVKLSHLSHNGAEVILGLRGPTDAVHVTGSPSHDVHRFSARAMVTCRTLTWKWSILEDFLIKMPRFISNIGQILENQLSDLQDRYCEMSSEKVDARLSWVLIRLARQVGSKRAGGVEIAISRLELAQMCGATLFTVSRLISKWGAQGLVLPRREGIVVLDTDPAHFISDPDAGERSSGICENNQRITARRRAQEIFRMI